MTEPSDRRPWPAIAAGVAAAMLMVSVATAGDVPLFERYPDISLERWQGEGVELELLEGVELPEEETEVFKIWEVDLPDFLADLLRLLLVVAAIAAILTLWQRRPRLRWRLKKTAEEFNTLDDLASLIEADAAAQRRTLSKGTPRNAIVACWLRLEALTVEAGFERRPADTSEEFTARILSQFAVDQSAATRLAALYREARFSSRDIDEAQRIAALDALDAVHRGLRSDAPA